MKSKTLLITCLLFLLKPSLHAQDSIRCGSWLSVNAHYGFILPLYQIDEKGLIKGHIPGFEINYMKSSDGGTLWSRAYHCPEMGIAVFYAWLANPNQLGSMIGVYPFFNFHLQRSYKERMYLRIGIGLGYLPVTYNRLNNSKNDLIGSHINAMMNARLIHHFYLSEYSRIETGLGLTHCSNGSFKTPNLGINVMTINGGYSYCLHPCKRSTEVYKDTITCHKYQPEIIYNVGCSELEPPGGRKYFCSTLTFNVYRPSNFKNRFGAGVDIFYDGANIGELKSDSIKITNVQNIQVGVKICYQLIIGKLAFPIELGGYAYTIFNRNGYEYNRLGLRYYANRHLILNLNLLAHFASADYVEWGLGYKF